MAESNTIPAGNNGNNSKPQSLPGTKSLSRAQQLNKLYALPAPLRTFPLPTFVPHNPLSLFHVLYAWLSQAIQRPSSHFEIPYQGWFSPETRSIHVTDMRSVRGLWEQGFYGKGSLSRSEPSWLDREKARKGAKSSVTSEEITRKRRVERQQAKWERARKEREAIEQKLLEEAEAALTKAQTPDQSPSEISRDKTPENPADFGSPVGPLELLALPNSPRDVLRPPQNAVEVATIQITTPDTEPISNLHSDALWTRAAPTGPLELLALPNSQSELVSLLTASNENGDINGEAKVMVDAELDSSSSEENTEHNPHDAALHLDGLPKEETPYLNGDAHKSNGTANGSHGDHDPGHMNGNISNGSANGTATPKMKRQKSVRFSPTVEQNTFIHTEPPRPERTVTPVTKVDEEPPVIVNQEHFQLTMEEAFFLSYGLGALQVMDPDTKAPLSNEELFTLFRKTSYFPPRLLDAELAPDDPFLVSYLVYHHFRSLGWVVRGGIKFSVDYLLYNRGPVFSHAEFAILILPSYSDPYWSSNAQLQNYVKRKEKRGNWAWLHGINRVQAQVKKTLVLVYVDIPRPLSPQEKENDLGVDGVLARYKIREFVLKRWLSNRMRD